MVILEEIIHHYHSLKKYFSLLPPCNTWLKLIIKVSINLVITIQLHLDYLI
jgi:hypothetical protein